MTELKTLTEIMDEGFEFPTSIDDLTKETIIGWFGLRRVANNKNFARWFTRQLNLSYPYYRQLMRIDPTISDFDWLIENYLESKSNGTRYSDNKNEKITSTKNDSTTTTGGTTTTKTVGSSESGDTTTTSDTEKHADLTGTYERNEGMARTAPMSAEYSADDLDNADSMTIGSKTISGYHQGLAKPSILNPTSVTDQLNTSQTATDGKHESSGTSTSTGNTSHDETTTGEINNNVKVSGTIGASETDTNVNNRTTEDLYISSGRNTDIATLIDKARYAIINSRAWDYLYRQLNLCFMQVYEEEDYYE